MIESYPSTPANTPSLRKPGGTIRRRLARFAALAMLLGLTACGRAPGEDDGDFVGSWMETGQEWLTCNGSAMAPKQVMDTFTINRGIDASLTVILMNPSCVLKFDVSGETATLRSGQTCSQNASGATVTLALASGSFTLNNPTSGTLIFAGTATGTSATKAVQCTVSAMSSATKVGQ
jgi:hypothetical protein